MKLSLVQHEYTFLVGIYYANAEVTIAVDQAEARNGEEFRSIVLDADCDTLANFAQLPLRQCNSAIRYDTDSTTRSCPFASDSSQLMM
jgi:hypothetical protein